MILKRFRLNRPNRKIDDLYGAIVAQSRRSAFYVGYGVPDTIDGRFDLIVLHMVLLLARLRRFMEDRVPILPPWARETVGSLRRRWRAISLRVWMGLGRAGWRVTRVQ